MRRATEDRVAFVVGGAVGSSGVASADGVGVGPGVSHGVGVVNSVGLHAFSASQSKTLFVYVAHTSMFRPARARRSLVSQWRALQWMVPHLTVSQ